MMTEIVAEGTTTHHARDSARDALVLECVAWRRAGAVPKQFVTPLPANASPEHVKRVINEDAHKIFGAAMLLKKAGVNNILSWLSRVYYVNNAPAIWGELPLHLAQIQPDFNHEVFETYEVDFDGKRISIDAGFDTAPHWATVCVIGRKGGKPQAARWTLQDCYRAGHFAIGNANISDKAANDLDRSALRRQFLQGKFIGGVWVSYGRRMMQQRAVALALRMAYPGLLDGIAVMEYDLDTMPQASKHIGKRVQSQDVRRVYLNSLQAKRDDDV